MGRLWTPSSFPGSLEIGAIGVPSFACRVTLLGGRAAADEAAAHREVRRRFGIRRPVSIVEAVVRFRTARSRGCSASSEAGRRRTARMAVHAIRVRGSAAHRPRGRLRRVRNTGGDAFGPRRVVRPSSAGRPAYPGATRPMVPSVRLEGNRVRTALRLRLARARGERGSPARGTSDRNRFARAASARRAHGLRTNRTGRGFRTDIPPRKGRGAGRPDLLRRTERPVGVPLGSVRSLSRPGAVTGS